MRSAGFHTLASAFALALMGSRALAGVDVRTVSDTNGRLVVELHRGPESIDTSASASFFAAISPTGTYSTQFRVGPATSASPVAAGVAADSLIVSAPFVLRGARVLWLDARIPPNVPVSHVTVDYTPAAQFNNRTTADPIVRTLVANTDVFPLSLRSASSDPWFSLAPNWARLSLSARGMYSVTGADLIEAGFSLASIDDPATLRLFSSGGLNQPLALSDADGSWRPGQTMREVPIRVEGGGDGSFDPGDRIVFYGLPTSDWEDYYDPAAADTLYHEHTHAKTNVYFLGWGGSLPGTPARIADLASTPSGNPDATTYRHREYQERDLISDYDYRGDGWLWRDIRSAGGSRYPLSSIEVRNLVSSLPQTFRTVALAKFSSPQDTTSSNIGHRAVYWNFRGGQEVFIGEKVWNTGGADIFYGGGRPVRVETDFLLEGTNQFRFQVPGNLNRKDKMFFAWYSIAYQRRIIALNNAIGFSSPDTTGVVNFRADGFTGADAIHAFDVTDAWNPMRLTGFEESTVPSGRRVRLSSSHAGGGRHFWVATSGALLEPSIARATPVDLRADAVGPNMLIVTHESFLSSAERLRSYRAGNRLPLYGTPVVEVVAVDDIFDNFSQGLADPMAIRNYIKYLYENYPDANGNPRLGYVCFFGDASIDFQNHASTQPDFVPSNLYFAGQAPYTFATDEWFGHMDAEDQVPGRDVLDLAIGRLPAASSSEAQFLVDRIMDYETASPLERWRQEIILVADDEISSFPNACEKEWTSESEDLAYLYAPNFPSITKIYLTEYPLFVQDKPQSRFDFLDEWSDGALLINYIGHGSSVQMADEKVFLGSDVSQLTNGLKLPLMMAFSCTIGDFANPTGKCLSEKLLLHDAGGVIGALTASTESYPGPNRAVNRSIYERLLPRKLDAEVLPLGVGILHAKAQAQALQFFQAWNSENAWKYNLLSDPAATLRIPRREIRFETSGEDTLVAGARESLRGRVYVDGTPDTGFDGLVTVSVREPTVHREYETRCGSGGIFMLYTVPGGVMYDGTADVTGGAFEVSFRVPRYAATGPLAIASAYANEGSLDAGATIDSVLVVLAPTLADSLALKPVDGAPRVDLGFKSGLTLVKPGDTVRAVVRDQDGINILATTNEGRQAILLDKLPLPIDVNEFFHFDHGGIDTSGVLLFPLPDLAVGPHRLVYKVSDSFGSTTLDTLAFDVTDAANYYAEAVLNYPNPFKTSTQFLFRLSNRASVEIDIFTVSGKRVRTIEETREGGEVWIPWDGLDASGGDLANGTYLFVATVDFDGLERAPVVLRGKLSKIR